MIEFRFDTFVDPDPTEREDNIDELVFAHLRCAAHRQEVLASKQCGCFSCSAIFAPTDITEWLEEKSAQLSQRDDPWTAICPNCGIDAVIGTASGFPVDQPGFLQALNERWFTSAQN